MKSYVTCKTHFESIKKKSNSNQKNCRSLKAIREKHGALWKRVSRHFPDGHFPDQTHPRPETSPTDTSPTDIFPTRHFGESESKKNISSRVSGHLSDGHFLDGYFPDGHFPDQTHLRLIFHDLTHRWWTLLRPFFSIPYSIATHFLIVIFICIVN